MKEKATKADTNHFTSWKNISEDKRKEFTDLSISAIGIGTYLGDADEKTDSLYYDSIRKALISGVNLIDTAINYRQQRSEKIVGRAIASLEKEKINRKQIVLSTKGGFLSCEEGPKHYFDFIKKRYIDTKIIKEADIVDDSHCMSPAFLSAEIDFSLKNMNVVCIDLYYIHNPEVQLFSIPEEHFYQRLEEAFILLEKKVEEGKISSYGLATWNGFRQKKGSKGYLDLTRIYEIAESISKNHHFTCVQIPFNLIMLEMIKLPNQSLLDKSVPFITLATERNLSVVVSAPLMQSYVQNLPSRIFDNLPGSGTPVQKALQFVLSIKGVTATLLGMKSPGHVKENLKLLSQENWDEKMLKKAYKLLGV
jgi:aryl-alcohol dehydrogenase-like predicted oxidoreductase